MANKKSKLTPDTEFIRLIEAKREGTALTIIVQPYCVGTYHALHINNQTVGQNGMTWCGHARWEKTIETKLKADGFTVEVTRARLGDYISESDIKIINGN